MSIKFAKWLFLSVLVVASMTSVAAPIERMAADELSPEFYFFQYDYQGGPRYRAKSKLEARDFTLYSKMTAVDGQNRILSFEKCADGKFFVLLRAPTPIMRAPLSDALVREIDYELRVYRHNQSRLLFTRRFAAKYSYMNDDQPDFMFSADCKFITQVSSNAPYVSLDPLNHKEIPFDLPKSYHS